MGEVAVAGPQRPLDPESRQWLDALCADGAVRDEAVERLHALLLRAARFEAARRRASASFPGEVDAIVADSAGDALVAVLARLDELPHAPEAWDRAMNGVLARLLGPDQTPVSCDACFAGLVLEESR